MSRGVFFTGAGLLLVCVLQDPCFAQVSAGEKKNETERAQYKNYQNDHYSFAFEYPVAWSLSEALDGNGVSVSPNSHDRSHIAVSARKVMATEAHALSVEEDFDESLRSLGKKRSHPGHHPENVKLVKKEAATFLGLPAIVSTVKFEKDGQNWVEQGILVHSQDGNTAYDIGLDCHPEELPAFQLVYAKLVRTFRILGPPK